MARNRGIGFNTPDISQIAFNIKGTNKMSIYVGRCIYKITSPSGKVYIGQSKNVEQRLCTYSGARCYEQTKLYHSILKYGWRNHSFEILEQCNTSNVNEREKFWISHYDSASINGLNILTGGIGSQGRVWTKEAREKMKNANLGRKQSPETIEKRRLSNTGKKRSEETKLKMSNSLKGRKMSPESIAKMIKSKTGRKQSATQVENLRQKMLTNNPFKGKKHTEETKAKMREAKAKSKLLKIAKIK